ncbi:unnamed protein product [Nesidiocoris tenuis]|uniref:Uncharacterized protein n=1 Tax=Nesidiocoris tenuis TaxID=355587 RepID=A0A6H5HGE7_9HEMI|nr:unnamed protein product [Nesidiocoris tenuis]
MEEGGCFLVVLEGVARYVTRICRLDPGNPLYSTTVEQQRPDPGWLNLADSYGFTSPSLLDDREFCATPKTPTQLMMTSNYQVEIRIGVTQFKTPPLPSCRYLKAQRAYMSQNIDSEISVSKESTHQDLPIAPRIMFFLSIFGAKKRYNRKTTNIFRKNPHVRYKNRKGDNIRTANGRADLVRKLPHHSPSSKIEL